VGSEAVQKNLCLSPTLIMVRLDVNIEPAGCRRRQGLANRKLDHFWTALKVQDARLVSSGIFEQTYNFLLFGQ
jgi:hypothetical protein